MDEGQVNSPLVSLLSQASSLRNRPLLRNEYRPTTATVLPRQAFQSCMISQTRTGSSAAGGSPAIPFSTQQISDKKTNRRTLTPKPSFQTNRWRAVWRTDTNGPHLRESAGQDLGAD